MSLGTPEALRLLRRDAVLKRVIRPVGPFTLKPARRQPYEALVRAIAQKSMGQAGIEPACAKTQWISGHALRRLGYCPHW